MQGLPFLNDKTSTSYHEPQMKKFVANSHKKFIENFRILRKFFNINLCIEASYISYNNPILHNF